jgi:protein-S-isoprenylcysteine O-methyltransferase Ste14
MDLKPVFQLGVMNAWMLCIPFLLPAFFIGAMRKDIAKRMSDMTGYDIKEKFFTISASLAPYPFMAVTAWTPFTTLKPFFCAGIILYCIGIAGFYSTIFVFANTPPNKPLSTGVYRFSRNPMYISSTLIFFSICLATANLLLLSYLIMLSVLQHFMILAEERACMEKYGMVYHEYTRNVPRYLLR